MEDGNYWQFSLLGCVQATFGHADQYLECNFMHLEISKKGGVLDSIEIRLTFIEDIKDKQFEVKSLNELRKKTVSGKAKDVVLDSRGVLSFKGKIFIPQQMT